jgi:hypothetical protein
VPQPEQFMTSTMFDKAAVEKLFTLGEGAFDRLSEAGTINAEAAKKFGASQADLAEAMLTLGGRQFELLGKVSEPAELLRAVSEYGEAFRGALDAYVTGVRGTAEEVRSAYHKLVLGATEKATA